jgi:hypothetical protein
VEGDQVSVIIVSALVFLSGLAVIWMAMQSRRQIREMEHRERLAMIERGLVPGMEIDPGALDRRFTPARAPESRAASRARTGGVTLISLGLALMFMLTFAAGQPEVGLGIGGAFALVGAGFYVNSVLINKANNTYVPTISSQPPDHDKMNHQG